MFCLSQLKYLTKIFLDKFCTTQEKMGDEPPVKKARFDNASITREKIEAGGEEEEEDMGYLTNIGLFQELPTELGINKASMEEYRPSNSINELGILEICVPARGMTYFDLSKTLLYVRARIAKMDGSKVEPTVDKVTWANVPLHTFFRQIEVTLQNEVLTSGVNNNYPYKAIFDILTNYEAETKDTQLQGILFSKDSRTAVDDNDPTHTTNTGLRWRYSLTKDGKAVDMLGPIITDIAKQERLILNNVKLTVRLFPTPHAFNLMSKEVGKYKTVLEDVVLQLATVEVSNKVVVGHDDALKDNTALYYIKRSEIKPCCITVNTMKYAVDDLFCSKIPSKIMVGFVDTQAYLGSELQSPYNFKNYGLNFLNVEINGASFPKYPFKPNFAEKQYVVPYLNLFTGSGTLNTNSSNNIEREDFPSGYAIYVIPIDVYVSDDWITPQKSGNTRLNVEFSSPLPESVTMLLYGVFDDIIEIDRSRNVKMRSKATRAIGGGLALL